MKIVHVPFSFHPDPVGGTEIYVEALARQQQLEGMTAVVAAPGRRDESYVHRGLKVFRFEVPEQVDDIGELYGAGDQRAAIAFAGILNDETPDVVHLHAFTRGVSLRLARAATGRGIPVIFSYHTPTVSCQRGTLVRWGIEVCGGELCAATCTRCTLNGLGLNKAISTIAGSIPAGVGRLVGSCGLSGGVWTALRMTELVSLRHTAVRALLEEVGHVVAMCGWVKAVLLRNGIADEKVTISRQGLGIAERSSLAARRDSGPGLPLQVMFIGRFDPAKGVHILLEALRASPELPLNLDIFGVVQGDSNAAYLASLQDMADR